jgi:hypothetical protein
MEVVEELKETVCRFPVEAVAVVLSHRLHRQMRQQSTVANQLQTSNFLPVRECLLLAPMSPKTVEPRSRLSLSARTRLKMCLALV